MIDIGNIGRGIARDFGRDIGASEAVLIIVAIRLAALVLLVGLLGLVAPAHVHRGPVPDERPAAAPPKPATEPAASPTATPGLDETGRDMLLHD